jgi:hypothetical protein
MFAQRGEELVEPESFQQHHAATETALRNQRHDADVAQRPVQDGWRGIAVIGSANRRYGDDAARQRAHGQVNALGRAGGAAGKQLQARAGGMHRKRPGAGAQQFALHGDARLDSRDHHAHRADTAALRDDRRSPVFGIGHHGHGAQFAEITCNRLR